MSTITLIHRSLEHSHTYENKVGGIGWSERLLKEANIFLNKNIKRVEKHKYKSYNIIVLEQGRSTYQKIKFNLNPYKKAMGVCELEWL